MSNLNLERMSIKILLAEDNILCAKLAQLGLKRFELDVVKNGKEAVDLFLKKQYDIILMDLQMPVMSGIDATKEIRRIEKEEGHNSRTIIFAVSADMYNPLDKECLEAGFDDYFLKPFYPSNMSSQIEELLKKHLKPSIT